MFEMKKEDYEVPLMPNLGQHHPHHPHLAAIGGGGGQGGVVGVSGGNEHLVHHPHHQSQLGLDHMSTMGRDLLNMGVPPHGGQLPPGGGGPVGGLGGPLSMDNKSTTRSISPPMIPCGLTDEQLVTLSVRELNKQLKNKGLNKEEMGTMKQR